MEGGLDSFDERLKKKEDAATKMDGLKRNRKRNISYLKKPIYNVLFAYFKNIQ
jgi:hypothetical protein